MHDVSRKIYTVQWIYFAIVQFLVIQYFTKNNVDLNVQYYVLYTYYLKRRLRLSAMANKKSAPAPPWNWRLRLRSTGKITVTYCKKPRVNDREEDFSCKAKQF